MPSRFQSLVSTKTGASRWFETSQADAVALAAVLDAHCRERLANYKVPKAIHVREDLPRLAIGKVDRRALATEAAASTSAPTGS